MRTNGRSWILAGLEIIIQLIVQVFLFEIHDCVSLFFVSSATVRRPSRKTYVTEKLEEREYSL